MMFHPLVLEAPSLAKRFRSFLNKIELKAIGSRRITVEIPQLGLKYIVPTHALIGRLLRENGMYEEHIVNWITERFTPGSGGIFVDVGANLGWYSCLFAKIAGANGQVFLYEPAPENIDLVARNLALNGFANFHMFEAGAGSERSRKALHIAHYSNPGAHTLVDGLYSEGDVEVPIVTLDETIIPQIGNREISLLKMDIEGFELEALRGASVVLLRTRALIIEFSPQFLKRGGYDPSELWRTLGKFERFRFEQGKEPVPITQEPDRHCDLLLLRP